MALFIILEGLTMTLFSAKMLISHKCMHGLMPNLIKKSWTVSRGYDRVWPYRVRISWYFDTQFRRISDPMLIQFLSASINDVFFGKHNDVFFCRAQVAIFGTFWINMDLFFSFWRISEKLFNTVFVSLPLYGKFKFGNLILDWSTNNIEHLH